MLKRKIATISALSLLCATLFGRVVLAAKCGDTDTYFDWGCGGSSDQVLLQVVATILNWLAAGLSIVVLLAIVYGAIIYMTAGSDAGKLATAKKIIRNAIGALIAYFFMYSLLNFLVPGGLFA